MDIIENKYLELLKKYIKKSKRLSHSVSCANFMKKYAQIFDIDPDKAYVCGLLHDIGKEIEPERMLKLAGEYNNRNVEKIEFYDFKKRHIFLLHGNVSSEIMIRELNIQDKEILISASHHTTGGTNLSKLAKFTFLSDFCEPDRKYKPSKIVYNTLIKEKNFNKALFLTYKFVINNLLEKNWEICPESIEGYNEALLSIDSI